MPRRVTSGLAVRSVALPRSLPPCACALPGGAAPARRFVLASLRAASRLPCACFAPSACARAFGVLRAPRATRLPPVAVAGRLRRSPPPHLHPPPTSCAPSASSFQRRAFRAVAHRCRRGVRGRAGSALARRWHPGRNPSRPLRAAARCPAASLDRTRPGWRSAIIAAMDCRASPRAPSTDRRAAAHPGIRAPRKSQNGPLTRPQKAVTCGTPVPLFRKSTCSRVTTGDNLQKRRGHNGTEGPVSRILSMRPFLRGAALNDHSSRPRIAAWLQQPTREFGAPGRHARAAEAAVSPPIWSCSVWGLPCRLHCCLRGALLPHLFTLTQCLRKGRYFLCGTGRLVAFKRRSRALPGTLPRGVRTFLPCFDKRARSSSDRSVRLRVQYTGSAFRSLPRVSGLCC